MKKTLLMLLMVVVATATGFARKGYSHDDSVLPEPAKNMISNTFKAKVSLVKVEKEFGRVDEYEVILTDGTEVSFDRAGNWKSVETSARQQVPASIVPDAISKYVSKNHKNTTIVGIEKKRGGYEIELSNGVETKFNAQGQFLRYD